MAAYLIAEEGPLSGMTVALEEGEEWVLGRDPDEVSIVLEDPMVSRKHVICTLTKEGYVLENLSSVNPATQNGKVIAEPVLLKESDILQIGSTFFRFTLSSPEKEEKATTEIIEDPEDLSLLSLDVGNSGRWLLKVIAGPNAGAEFIMKEGSSYTIGKDPAYADIVFQDLSVSRQHAKITIDHEGSVYIEDVGSRNGVLINGALDNEKHKLDSQDVVSLGTTAFLIVDREQESETIVSNSPFPSLKEEEKESAASTPSKKDWKEMKVSKRHLVVFGVSVAAIIMSIGAMLALFRTEPVEIVQKDESKYLEEALKNFPSVQFSYNETTGKVFLVGHVLTVIDKQELLYLLNNIPYIRSIEDNVVVDELVWQNMNALLMTNPAWEGVSFHSPTPGRFIMRGYLQNLEEMQALSDFVNINFPYLDRLDNQVVVENNLATQIQGLLTQGNFSNIQFQIASGELILSGKIGENVQKEFEHLLIRLKNIAGIRVIKNFVVITSAQSARVDLSNQYQVTGFSKTDDTSMFVVINGKILGNGDILDGMTITAIEQNIVLLEKDGIKFRINYNLQ